MFSRIAQMLIRLRTPLTWLYFPGLVLLAYLLCAKIGDQGSIARHSVILFTGLLMLAGLLFYGLMKVYIFVVVPIVFAGYFLIEGMYLWMGFAFLATLCYWCLRSPRRIFKWLKSRFLPLLYFGIAVVAA